MIRILFTFLSLSIAAWAQHPDWSAANRESLDHLTGLIHLATSQPEGNEIIAARYIKRILDAEGIASEIFEAAPSRASIVARLNGNGSKRPLLLLGHLDVVAVERENWSFDPFSGTVKDGKIFGRGSADDKGVVAGRDAGECLADLGSIFGIALLVAGHADDPAVLGDLAVGVATQQARQQLAQCQVAGAAEDDEIEGVDG